MKIKKLVQRISVTRPGYTSYTLHGVYTLQVVVTVKQHKTYFLNFETGNLAGLDLRHYYNLTSSSKYLIQYHTAREKFKKPHILASYIYIQEKDVDTCKTRQCILLQYNTYNPLFKRCTLSISFARHCLRPALPNPGGGGLKCIKRNDTSYRQCTTYYKIQTDNYLEAANRFGVAANSSPLPTSVAASM